MSYLKLGLDKINMPTKLGAIFIGLLLVLTGSAGTQAGEADIIAATIRKIGNRYAFDVTIKSKDTGWDYYADAFEVLSLDGKVLASRILLHPHETEQPFTRDLSDVELPPGTKRVILRARHKPVGYNGATLTLDVP